MSNERPPLLRIINVTLGSTWRWWRIRLHTWEGPPRFHTCGEVFYRRQFALDCGDRRVGLSIRRRA